MFGEPGVTLRISSASCLVVVYRDSRLFQGFASSGRVMGQDEIWSSGRCNGLLFQRGGDKLALQKTRRHPSFIVSAGISRNVSTEDSKSADRKFDSLVA